MYLLSKLKHPGEVLSYPIHKKKSVKRLFLTTESILFIEWLQIYDDSPDES